MAQTPGRIPLTLLTLQKRMLLQLPEQREAAENEIRTHRLVDHENVIKLVNAEIKDQRNGEGVALLLFPFYQVRRTESWVNSCRIHR